MIITKANALFKLNIREIIKNGCMDENPRPKYESDGEPAHSYFITHVNEKYDLSNNEFPLTDLREIPVFNGIKEIMWIYQDQTSNLSVLEEKYGIKWWRPWEVEYNIFQSAMPYGIEKITIKNTIGKRYGATVKKYDLMNQLLEGLIHDPYSRRHNINLWQYEDFEETPGLLPCAFLTEWAVRKVDGVMYLDCNLIQRSSDYLVAGHINKMQYVALQMMVAHHCGYEAGYFSHNVNNLHIYDRHITNAILLMSTDPTSENQPILKLNADKSKTFYDITIEDFELENYEPKQKMKFELGI